MARQKLKLKIKKILNLEFYKKESSGGVLLMITAVLAMVMANSPLQSYYHMIIEMPVAVKVGALEIAKPLLLWINDGMMAIFFFVVGLELKREMLEGELSDRRSIILPGIAAVGGMLVPSLLYIAFNAGDPLAMNGWAIPAATDIAFALGILMLLGSKVPVGIKVFLTSVAIFDDLGAIVIIAMFYTENISLTALVIVLCCLPVLALLNRIGSESKSLYILVAIVMWVAMLKSGVHATLTGVIVAMFIPMRSKLHPEVSPVKALEHDLHTVVAFLVLPTFAFANAGLNLANVGFDQLLHPVPLGIAVGLFAGKQIGIFLFSWICVVLKFAELPKGMNWGSLYGTAILCGVGFTMSLFIGSLAFDHTSANTLFDERLGIIIGSLVSGIVGYVILNATLKEKELPVISE